MAGITFDKASPMVKKIGYYYGLFSVVADIFAVIVTKGSVHPFTRFMVATEGGRETLAINLLDQNNEDLDQGKQYTLALAGGTELLEVKKAVVV